MEKFLISHLFQMNQAKLHDYLTEKDTKNYDTLMWKNYSL